MRIDLGAPPTNVEELKKALMDFYGLYEGDWAFDVRAVNLKTEKRKKILGKICEVLVKEYDPTPYRMKQTFSSCEPALLKAFDDD